MAPRPQYASFRTRQGSNPPPVPLFPPVLILFVPGKAADSVVRAPGRLGDQECGPLAGRPVRFSSRCRPGDADAGGSLPQRMVAAPLRCGKLSFP
jgi:hypothetical protein